MLLQHWISVPQTTLQKFQHQTIQRHNYFSKRLVGGIKKYVYDVKTYYVKSVGVLTQKNCTFQEILPLRSPLEHSQIRARGDLLCKSPRVEYVDIL